MKTFLFRAAIGFACAGALPAIAMAQAPWAPGSEVVGQPLQVTTNGVTNTVYLDPNGQLRIMTPGGNTIPGTWTAANGQLCLNTGPQECIPYAAPFQAAAPETVTSSCGASETWVAQAVNNAPPPPAQSAAPERGR